VVKQENASASDEPLHERLNHYPQSTLTWADGDGWMSGSQVLLSRRAPPLDAIVFLHGWGGAASSTWEAFPRAVGALPVLAKADAFFLDYPSTTSQVAFCAAQFRRFLHHLVSEPAARMLNESLPKRAASRALDFKYQRVIIVAHSMGAVVARRAILDIDRSPPPGFERGELAKFRLLFFAPAHCGSSIPLLIGSGLGLDFLPGAAAVGSMARLWFQSLRDLEEGSLTLEKLAADSRSIREARAAAGESLSHMRAVVHHAHNDRVVVQHDFDDDPPFEPVLKRNHRSICKPIHDYLQPIEALLATLRR
jgi:pimeloyl-ACP methyl ester carboxylesterase